MWTKLAGPSESPAQCWPLWPHYVCSTGFFFVALYTELRTFLNDSQLLDDFLLPFLYLSLNVSNQGDLPGHPPLPYKLGLSQCLSNHSGLSTGPSDSWDLCCCLCACVFKAGCSRSCILIYMRIMSFIITDFPTLHLVVA